MIAIGTAKLKEEFAYKPTGENAAAYFRSLGAKMLAQPASHGAVRAAAAQALLSLPGAHIYVNDRIAGSLRPLWKELDDTQRAQAQAYMTRYRERTFPENHDHYAADYRTLVREGLPGLFARIRAAKLVHAQTPERLTFLDEMETALNGLRGMIENYAALAGQLTESMTGTAAENAAFIAQNCRALLAGAPQSFAQGLQLVWFTHLCFVYEGRYAMALGRIDQYLYPLYKMDTEAGRLTPEEATALLENVFIKQYERTVFFGSDDVVNICIGGTAPDGSCEVNELSWCVLRAVGNCNIPGPNLSARISKDTPDAFLDECLKTIGTGLGYPALMNDEVNIPALARFGYALEDVCDYCMVGCIENFITGKQPPWSDGRFDTPRYFEYLFNRGVGAFNKSTGLDTGPVESIGSMEELLQRFEVQLAAGVKDYVQRFLAVNTAIVPEEYTSPFLSCFTQDCIARGRDINNGGCVYPSVHGAALMGVGTTADALAAIERVVFEEKAATLEELRQALTDNFVGHEVLHKKLLAAPKYGNDDWFVDKYAVWFTDFLAGEFDKYRTPDGGGFYVAMAANTSNIHAGMTIAATPDGRLQGQPLSDAASPTYGRDVNGPTATVNSVTKPDYTKVACGTVVNQKFSPEMFSDENRPRLAALLRVYFARGGQEMQINATSRQTLIDAMAHPEKYPSMVVRVSGFSAVYVTLAPEVQLDILNRTQQE